MFEKWLNRDFYNWPIAEDFIHTNPSEAITGKQNYIEIVEQNKDKFLNYNFNLHGGIYGSDKACLRYTAIRGEFELKVSEWYFEKNNLISEIY